MVEYEVFTALSWSSEDRRTELTINHSHKKLGSVSIKC